MPDKAVYEQRTLTQQQLLDEARARFGPDPSTWAYQCPNCGDVAVMGDFPDGLQRRIGAECHRGALGAPDGGDGREQAERGCNWTAYGLIPGPWTITLPDGRSGHVFPLAPAAPHRARPAGGAGAP